jgi:hypothetical protein
MAEDNGSSGEGGAMDPAMMEKMMAAMGGGGGMGGGGEGGDGGEGGEGGMDMAKLQAMLAGMQGGGGGGMGGMGGGNQDQQTAQRNQAEHASKNDGEKEAEGYSWEQTSKYGESEILIRFTLEAAATKKDVKVAFGANSLKVTVAGKELLNGKTFGRTYPDDSTWCLVEKGSELQVLVAPAEDTKWSSLLKPAE